MQSDVFELYDLLIEVHHDGKRPMVCNHTVGMTLFVSGENLKIQEGMTFPIYALAAIIPLLPAKQRVMDPYDWMTSDSDVACPDPYCGGIFRIKRLQKRKFFRHQTTVTPLPKELSQAEMKKD